MFGRRDARTERDRRGAVGAGDRGPETPAGAAAETTEPIAALPPRLVDLASDWLALIPALRRSPDLSDPARLRQRAAELRDELERRARQSGYDDRDIKSAVFSLTALLDETVKRGRGRAREEWLARSLALEWFQNPNAGVAFYERLDELRRDRRERIEAIEVAACCLGLGFEGRLATAPREARAGLLNDLLLDVAAVRGEGRLPLSPHLLTRDPVGGRVVSGVSRWIMVAVFVISLLVIWVAITQLSHLEAAHAVHEIRPLSP